ncbi:Uncharacterised protein [Mycobacterium tuberculosis]|nr:Uncharacterised protein [Mycobacterium tuberculosis]CNV90385.1 Uncharacterised protein [Mycobacterium tuberculosis]
MSAVGGGEGGDDGQAEAAAATAAGGVGAGESVEGDGKKVVGESGAVVADADVDCTVAGVRGDSDFTVPVGDGVVEHGGEDSAQVVRIDRDEQVRFRACGDVRSSSGEAGHALVQQGSDRHRFGGGVGFGAVGAGQGEQLVGQSAEPAGFFERGAQGGAQLVGGSGPAQRSSSSVVSSANGVRNSWLASATNCCSWARARCSRVSMVLRVVASQAISSSVGGTGSGASVSGCGVVVSVCAAARIRSTGRSAARLSR